MAAAPGCGWQSYAVTRTARHFTGVTTRVHVISPLVASLREYRVIELSPVANLLPAHAPAAVSRDLDARLERALGSMPTGPRVDRMSADVPSSGADRVESEPAVVIDAALDDFDAGSRVLRVFEVGFNHVAVTVRVQASRRDNGDVLGAISVTAQDDRESGSTSAAMDRVVRAIGSWVKDGYAR
jgi:hypothetical protein